MKNLKKLFVRCPGYLTMLFALLLISVLQTSCKRLNDGDAQPVAALSVVNLIPGESSLDFYLDNQRVNGASLLYLQSVDYFNAYPGVRKFDATIGGTDQVLATGTGTLTAGKYHTLFINQTDQAQFLLTTDDLSDPAAGKANIRFVNLSPGASGADLMIAGGAALFNNQAYNSYSDFISADPGTYTLETHQTSNASQSVTKTNVTINAGGVYTIISNGSWGSSPQAVSLQVMVNK